MNKITTKSKFEASLENLGKALAERSQEYEETKKLKEELIQSQPKAEQQVFAFFPVELMKTSIFFPFSDQNINRENRQIEKIKINHNWGELEIEGVKLAIYQEDLLLTMLTDKESAKEQKNNGSTSSFNIKYSLNKLARGKSKSGANKKDKQRVLNTLKDFQLTNFTIVQNKKDSNGKSYKNIHSVGGIVNGWHYNEKKDELTVKFNPEFWMLFGEGLISCINVTERKKLKADSSKALLRFINAHKQPTNLHMITVMQAMNWNMNQPPSKLWRFLNKAINELIKQGHLAKGSKVTKGSYMVFLEYPKTSSKKKLTK